jgi:2-polyprenyl-3-methyl-5-hydroxy-6-metoxy-1,4-benzoquinol methylase
MTVDSKLDQIAHEYHQRQLPDMHIERICQEYEIKWIMGEIRKVGTTVLDLGYGDGLLFPVLASEVDLTVVEGSKSLAEAAREYAVANGLNAQIEHCLFESFESEKRFDVILASHVLEHVGDPVALLLKLKSLLKPNGVIVGIVPNAESFHRKLGWIMGLNRTLDELSARDLMVGHQRVYSLMSLISDLSKAGFKITNHRGFFIKVLANSQMLHLEESVISGMVQLSDSMPTEICANIGFIGKPY